MAKSDPRPATSHITPFGLRMQPELKERLEAAASESGRSLNAEIVARLDKSLTEARSPDSIATMVRLTSALAIANMARLGAEMEKATVISNLRILAQRMMQLAEDSDPDMAEAAEVMLDEANALYRPPREIQKQAADNMAALTEALQYFGQLRNGETAPGIDKLIDDARLAMQPKRA